MATFSANNIQSTIEKHTYTVDFTADIPTGGSITAGTSTHYPPSGSGTAITTTVSSPYLYVTFPAQSTTGIHYVDVKATISDGDLPVVRIAIEVVYPSPTAREGMLDLIGELRGMTDAGVNDYTIVGVPYWSDKQLQDIMDRHAVELEYEPMILIPGRKQGGFSYNDYFINRKWIEQDASGTSEFIVQDINGGTIAAALYSVDYMIGEVSFVADQGSTVPYYVTCASYDLNAAAGEVWRKKASHYAAAYNFSTDNHHVSREQLYTHAREMADNYEGRSNEGASNIELGRPDDTYW